MTCGDKKVTNWFGIAFLIFIREKLILELLENANCKHMEIPKFWLGMSCILLYHVARIKLGPTGINSTPVKDGWCKTLCTKWNLSHCIVLGYVRATIKGAKANVCSKFDWKRFHTCQCERIGHTKTTIQQRPSASRVVIVHGVVVCNLAETTASGYLRRIYTTPQNDNSTLHDGTTTWWEQCHGQEEGHALTKENCKVILVISASLTILQKMSFTLCHYAWYLEGECYILKGWRWWFVPNTGNRHGSLQKW